MTPPDASVALAAIRAREQAATPGPWWGPGKPTPVDGWTLSVATVGEHHVGARPSLPSQVATEAADAEFIAHARADVPRMAAALDAVLALCNEAAPRRMGDGYLSASVLAPEDVRAAITDALGGGV